MCFLLLAGPLHVTLPALLPPACSSACSTPSSCSPASSFACSTTPCLLFCLPYALLPALRPPACYSACSTTHYLL